MKLKMSTLVFLMTTLLAGSAAYWGSLTSAAIFSVGGVLLWTLHVIEVKINKLLEDRGIYVSRAEIEQ